MYAGASFRQAGRRPEHGLQHSLLCCCECAAIAAVIACLAFAQILKPVLQAWYWDSRPNLVRRLMRLVLSRNVLDRLHPSGQTYEQVRRQQQGKGGGCAAAACA